MSSSPRILNVSHVDVVTVNYHWRVRVYWRKKRDNFQVETAACEPEKEEEEINKWRQNKKREIQNNKSISGWFRLFSEAQGTIVTVKLT